MTSQYSEHPPYRDYVKEAKKFPVNLSPEENIARVAARKVGWAVAEWYRKENGLDAYVGVLPHSLLQILEDVAPD